MIASDEFIRAGGLLESLLEERIAVEDALNGWPGLGRSKHPLLDAAWWQLNYLQNDQDLIAKDPEYGKNLVAELRRLYDEIVAVCDGKSEN